jgi:large-conductance mechanosensitive channel
MAMAVTSIVTSILSRMIESYVFGSIFDSTGIQQNAHFSIKKLNLAVDYGDVRITTINMSVSAFSEFHVI